MNKTKFLGPKSYLLIFPAIALVIVSECITFPAKFNWLLVLSLISIAIIERMYMHLFNKIWLPYFIIVIGLIIFAKHSILYSFFYLVPDAVIIWLKRRVSFWYDLLPSLSISLITIVLGNSFYNWTSHSYISRLGTLFLLFVVNWVLAYFFSFFESGKLTTSPVVSTFIPTWFEIGVIFPYLAVFNYFNYPVVMSSFLAYLIVVKVCHSRRMQVNESHVRQLISLIGTRLQLQVLLMDLGSIKGVYYPNKRIIVIDHKLDYPEQLDTLVHEWIHCELRKYKKSPLFLEEIWVTILEAVISWYYVFNLKRILSTGGYK
ncbi:hypothetical protein [Paenibacillus sp. WC2504]|uniref:hypothetical protein n=1 Tax=Paenibacillus sp. WC2504 TaxID=3461403 RepID=UPI0040466182